VLAVRALQGAFWFAVVALVVEQRDSPGRQASWWGAWLGLDGWNRSTVDGVFGACDG
jgi:hypothetical protein